MNTDAELLNFVYQNSQMGIKTLQKLIPMVKDESLKKQLQSQLDEYQKINCLAKEYLNQHGCEEKNIGTLEQVSAYMMINMKTMMDQSAGHIAQMLIQGSNMGIIDAIKNIRKYEHEAQRDNLLLMKRLLKFEEDNVEQLKQYL